MKVDVIKGNELSPDEVVRWEEVRNVNRSLASPYFSPVFTQLVASTRDTVRVGVIREGSTIAGFFPFEVGRNGVGKPVGGSLSDYQALIMEEQWEPLVPTIVHDCGLSTWTFDHLLAAQSCFHPYAHVQSESPVISLASGFSGYEADRSRRSSKVIQRTASKKRKMERELAPCKFEFTSGDPESLDFVIRLKSEQCRRTGTFDFFSVDANRELIRLIHERRVGDFQGVLSTLRSGDDLVAAHFGMRSGSTLHWWFPVYNHEYAAYRPGQVLLLEILRNAEDQGISLVDLGKGDDHYKKRFMTGSVALLEGKVYTHSALAMASWIVDGLEGFLRKSPWMQPVRAVGRRLRRR